MIILILIIIVVIFLGLIKARYIPKGEQGENEIAKILSREIRHGKQGYVLQNVYVPKPDGTTTEIDLLFVSVKGIFVIESKNYAGYIFGSEDSQNWTVSLYAGRTWYGGMETEKHQFYNPIWQNRSHIKHLREYLKANVPYYSLIVFSDRSEFKNIKYEAENTWICHTDMLHNLLSRIWKAAPDALRDFEVERAYTRLQKLTSDDPNVRNRHIQQVQRRLNDPTTCPLCGGRLLERTARRTGKHFYGCSNYPKCKYTRNISTQQEY